MTGTNDDTTAGSDAAAGDERARLQADLAERRRLRDALAAEIQALEAKLMPGGAFSPLAPDVFPALPAVGGVRLATGRAGLKYAYRDDVLLVALDPGTALAGVLTRSATRAAPVLWCEDRLAALAGAAPGGRAILVNAGNANAFTGAGGTAAVERLAGATAEALGIDAGGVLTASTGVIGEPLPDAKITALLDGLVARLAPEGLEPAARAIMTTDTFPKGSGVTAEIDATPVRVAGIAKGSGMIAPDMATMLAFVFTDAAVAQPVLQALTSSLVETTFNAVTVDGDTSTSDTLLVAATGKAGHAPIERLDDPRVEPLRAALHGVFHDLALQVVRDGEGATKLVRIDVAGAETPAAARRIARAIADSPLVKTAVAGQDPNWGRIVMAVGKAGERAERDRLTIHLGDTLVAENGAVAPSYREADGAAHMEGQEIRIGVDVGVGTGEATVWTCDLTARYVAINADYRS